MAELSITCPTAGTGGTVTVTGTFLTEDDHETLDTLVHSLSEDSFTEIVRDGCTVNEVNVLTTASGTPIRTCEVTARNSQGKVTETVEKQYDSSGSVVRTLTTTFTRDANGNVVSIDTEEVP